MDRWELINQEEQGAKRVSGNKRWLNSRRNSDEVTSSRNEDQKYHQKMCEKLVKSR